MKVNGKSLIECFFSTFTTRQEGLDFLNTKLGRSYQHSALSRWERGLREPTGDARHIMIRRILPELLKAHGKATPADVRQAAAKLR